MQFHVVTIFPELFAPFGQVGLLGKAVQSGRVGLRCISPRDFTSDKHQSVDDAPYGGGGGMVMSVVPLAAALEHIGPRGGRRILLTPQGQPLTQARVQQWAANEQALTLVCGRYEGVDERVRALVDEEVSLGDFVLNGGEVAALAIVEAVARLVPGVLGNAASSEEESHSQGLLEYPQYTRPRVFGGQAVPEVLLGGNHAEIARWRRVQALLRTRLRRPDLYARLTLSADERRAVDAALADRAVEAGDHAGPQGQPGEPEP